MYSRLQSHLRKFYELFGIYKGLLDKGKYETALRVNTNGAVTTRILESVVPGRFLKDMHFESQTSLQTVVTKFVSGQLDAKKELFLCLNPASSALYGGLSILLRSGQHPEKEEYWQETAWPLSPQYQRLADKLFSTLSKEEQKERLQRAAHIAAIDEEGRLPLLPWATFEAQAGAAGLLVLTNRLKELRMPDGKRITILTSYGKHAREKRSHVYQKLGLGDHWDKWGSDADNAWPQVMARLDLRGNDGSFRAPGRMTKSGAEDRPPLLAEQRAELMAAPFNGQGSWKRLPFYITARLTWAPSGP
ncbi:hypothetical protein BDZ90DRAFT_259186 [Jaminaea rosea]|uniref:Uncharacterized protein n=1 Tax=Jaminaea rosea TaxID=1569628 RepID=A0A316UV23_9BASI|nr:hypothetical protein BDZ90DRAFT_259186 [Jaminaea rosea]PWN29129.1 hypothetical protein BDZ90DRAFT_259186 [Jaminaea rosea]